MAWLVLFAAVLLVLFVAAIVNTGTARFQERVAGDARALLGARPAFLPRHETAELPPPVARYRALAAAGRSPVRTLRMRHGGTFRTSPRAKPSPIRGAQLFTTDPPGFVWTARVRIAPGLWIDARDMAVRGEGSMRVLLDDTVRLADAHGPELDQGAALRLLAEMPWFPTALFDARYVRWSAIDERHARATLRAFGREVSAVFEFGEDGLPARVQAERYTDEGVLRPWGGVFRDYRSVAGMLVPFEAEVSWELPEGTFTYAHWTIESMDYDDAFEEEAIPAARPTMPSLVTV